MKQILLFASLFITGFAFAQCVPNAPSNNEGLYPSELMEGFTMAQYDDTLTIVYPVDTVVSGFSIPLDSFKIDVISNMPNGITATCNDADCKAIPPVVGSVPATECIVFSGVPMNIPANDSVELSITVYATVFGQPQSFSGIIQKVRLPMSTVAVGVNDLATADGLEVYPNPSNGLVSLRMNQQWEGVSIEVTNMVGQIVKTVYAGSTNLFALELPEESGVYFVSIIGTDGKRAVKRIIRE